MKKFYRFCFWIFGWKLIGGKPDLKKYIVILAPHTSNYDFFVGVAARSLSGLNSYFLAKNVLFKIPIVGWLMKAIGGVPVDRSKNTKLVDQVVALYGKHDEFIITITPEGTRSYVPTWKTGFYRIAVQASIPIVMVGFDFERKIVEYREPFYPTGNLEGDMEMILGYYRNFKGRHPEQGVI
ncbi:MAG: 1-acyl-sn-glycerol-3-phosphate acyltransferase [Marinoscillum sp.]|jgi:1-acyl-sn-glycerol-3-phosphate acyltransferase